MASRKKTVAPATNTAPQDAVARPMIVDLSVDFDFFIREDPMWDWGHGESPQFASGMAWHSRYSSMDVYRETSPVRFADVLPEAFWDRLAFHFDIAQVKRIMIADSHRHAYDFFHNDPIIGRKPDMLVNIDAHHDFWDTDRMPGVQAENWAAHLYDRWNALTRFVQVYPLWKDPALDGVPARDPGPVVHHGLTTFLNTVKGAHVIRNLFICRSPEWVPPHHDKSLLKMMAQVARINKDANFIDPGVPMYKRTAPTPREAARMLAHHNEQMSAFMQQMKEQRTVGNNYEEEDDGSTQA